MLYYTCTNYKGLLHVHELDNRLSVIINKSDYEHTPIHFKLSSTNSTKDIHFFLIILMNLSSSRTTKDFLNPTDIYSSINKNTEFAILY